MATAPITNNHPRYAAILLMLADGSTVAEISGELGVAQSTVKHEISALKRMLGAKNLPNLIALAYQKRMLVSG